jgi:predicted TPR repeat methyltransferase
MNGHVNTEKWLACISKNPEEAETEYDEIAACYDDDVRKIDYRAPEDSARILAEFALGEFPALDVGCGTGLVGLKMKDYGFSKIKGIDISANSLKEAEKKGAYDELVKHNILEPFPFDEESFGAVTCVGVCSRFDDDQILSLVGELARVARKEGVILISHREDMMKSSEAPRKLADGFYPHVKLETVVGPYPYMEKDVHYRDIHVQYMVLRKK